MLARLECALGPRTAQALHFSCSQQTNWRDELPSKVIEYVCIQHNKGKKKVLPNGSRLPEELLEGEGEGDCYYFFSLQRMFCFCSWITTLLSCGW